MESFSNFIFKIHSGDYPNRLLFDKIEQEEQDFIDFQGNWMTLKYLKKNIAILQKLFI